MEERRFVRPGSVFVWEERSTTSEAAGLGIERWTDGLRWGPSRVRDVGVFPAHSTLLFLMRFLKGCALSHTAFSRVRSCPSSSKFLYYQEKYTKAEGHNILTKQTYSAWVDLPSGPRKWHLSTCLLIHASSLAQPSLYFPRLSAAYFTQATIGSMQTLDEIPCMTGVSVPPGMYRRSRCAKRKGDNRRLSLVDLPSPNSEPGSPRHEQEAYPLYLPFDSHGRSSPSPRRLSSSSGSDDHDDDFYPWTRPRAHTGYAFSVATEVDAVSSGLAPLSYLKSQQNPRRNPADEAVLRAFASLN